MTSRSRRVPPEAPSPGTPSPQSPAPRPATPQWKLLSALVLALVATMAGTLLHSSRGETMRGIHLFVSPHPDDELQAWSTLTNDPAVYTVFVVLTRGENTARCEPAWASAHADDAAPGEANIPRDPVGRGTDACGRARLDSWHATLDAAASSTRSAGLGEPVRHSEVEMAGRPADVWWGTQGARMALDLGDGGLTRDSATEGIRAAMEQVDREMGDLPLLMLTTASYYNAPAADPATSDPAALVYSHPDHHAVTVAGLELAPAFEDGTWAVTHPFDPRATDIRAIDESVYEEMMGLRDPEGHTWGGWRLPTQDLRLAPGGSPPDPAPDFPYTDPRPDITPEGSSPLSNHPRTGIYQQQYGWLAFPGPWVPGEYALAGSDALFPRHHAYIHATEGSDPAEGMR